MKKNIIWVTLLAVAVLSLLLLHSTTEAADEKWENKSFTDQKGNVANGFFLTLPKPEEISCKVNVFRNGVFEIVGADYSVDGDRTVTNYTTVWIEKDGRPGIAKRTEITDPGKGICGSTTEGGYAVFREKCFRYVELLPPDIKKRLKEVKNLL